MAFKFKGTGWQEGKGYTKSVFPCEICESRYDTGQFYNREMAIAGEKFPVLCEFHSNCTTTAINLVLCSKKSGNLVTKDVWDKLRLNSYDRDTLIPYMDNEVLGESIDFTLANCRRFDPPASVYDEALQLYAAEVRKRLAEANKLIGDYRRRLTENIERAEYR